MIVELIRASIWLICVILGYIAGKKLAKRIDDTIQAYIYMRYVLYKLSPYYELLRILFHPTPKE